MITKKTTFISSILLAIVAVFAALLLQRAFPVLHSEESIESNIGFFLLININIIAVMILGFIVVRNIIKLLLDRRKNILGARLRSRLVFAFIMLSMVPTVLLFLVAQGMVERVLQDWFSPKVEQAIDSSRQVAQKYFDSLEGDLEYKFSELLTKLNNEGNKEPVQDSQDEIIFLTRILNQLSSKYPDTYYAALKFDSDSDPTPIIIENKKLNLLNIKDEYLRSLDKKDKIIKIEQHGLKEYIRLFANVDRNNYSKKLKKDNPEIRVIFVLTKEVSTEISRSLKKLLEASDEYQEFKSYRRPLASSYFLTLVVVTLLIIFAAISIGFFVAKGLSVPIGLLAKGTEQVAHGNLSYKIPELGDDELGVLVRAFNKMTSDLKQTTDELLSRSRYIETVLANVGVGVMSVDVNGFLKTCNPSAYEILEVNESDFIINKPYKKVLPKDFIDALDEIQARSLRGKTRIASRSMLYPVGNRVKHLQINLNKLQEESLQTELGLVILVDDVTEFERAQRMAAWQEVARRIAHEIKNPLTPIQLSAERISRMKARLKDDILSKEEENIIDESTDVISTQVENLRVLVNEFSQFARMPKSELNYGDITTILRKSVETYRISAPDITITLVLEDSIPLILFDAFQIERVCINILDNAVSSLIESNHDNPKIEVSCFFESSSGLLIIDFSDNGIGVSDPDKSKLFEPYYTKKKGGTGLGLAIVKTVIADHNGFIRLLDNEGGGLIVRIELPVVR